MPQIKLLMVYIIDASALFDLKRWYPMNMEFFKPIWKRLDSMTKNGELIAPYEVLREVEEGDDEIKKWCREHRDMFIEIDEEQINNFKIVRDKYDPIYWKNNMGLKAWADPWVVSLALSFEIIRENGKKDKPTIVTSENKTKPNRIPAIAKQFGIISLNVPEFLKEIGVER